MSRAPAELRPVIRLLVIDERADGLMRLCDRLSRHAALHVHGLRDAGEAEAAIATGNFDAVVFAGAPPPAGAALPDTVPAVWLRRQGCTDAPQLPGSCETVEWAQGMDAHALAESIFDVYGRWRAARRRDTLARWVEREARFDHVTGLHNRRVFDERVADVAKGGESVALVLADIAGLQAINRAYGFATGDEVLRYVGGCIARCVRGEDVAARIGGDEFGLILPGSGLDVARMVARRVAQELEHEVRDDLPEVTLVFSLTAGEGARAGELFVAALAGLDERQPRPPVLALIGRTHDSAPGPGVA